MTEQITQHLGESSTLTASSENAHSLLLGEWLSFFWP
jgi:hypothetical protein